MMMMLMSFFTIPEPNCHQFDITIIELLQSAFFATKFHEQRQQQPLMTSSNDQIMEHLLMIR
jgi:hypothetical protein